MEEIIRCKYCNKAISGKTDTLPKIDNLLSDVCEDCWQIEKLKNYVLNYSNRHKENVIRNALYNKNLIKDDYDYGNGVKSYSLSYRSDSFKVEKRTKRVKMIINKIEKVRKYLYFELEPTFEILDSIIIKKDIFWEESGNLHFFVFKNCIYNAALRISEFLANKNSKYSVESIKKNLLAESKYVFKEQKIYEIIKFERSEDVLEEKYETFRMEEFASLIDDVINNYEFIIKSIKKYRDKHIAHVEDIDFENQDILITYRNLKMAFSLAKTIYDSFLYIVAPDKYGEIIFDSNMWIPHLNLIVGEHRKRIIQIKKRNKKSETSQKK